MKAVAAPSNCSIEWLFLVRSVPRYIRSDNGPSFYYSAGKTSMPDTDSR